MPKPSVPASELQDALSSAIATIMKATNHTLASVEEANKEELRRTLQDVQEAQRERDDLRREHDALVKEKAAVAVELETAKSEIERWRVAAEKAEWMINHQAETITQLRLEAQQWKDQFMRVDEERLRLSARNDELVSQQLYAARRDVYYQQEPLTPRSQGPQAQGSSSTRAASSTQYHASSVTANGYLTDGDVLSKRSIREQPYEQKPRARGGGGRNTIAHTKAQPVASSSRHVSQSISAPVQSKVLRTVHVVMQGAPVKEESLDSVTLGDAATGSESLGDDEEEVEGEIEPPRLQTQPKGRNTGKQKAPVRSQNARRTWSEGRQVHDDDEDSESDSAAESEDEYVPPTARKVSKSRARLDDEDEDELMLGGEADHRETYGRRTIVVNKTSTTSRRAQTQPAKQVNAASGSARKRNSPYPAGPGKKPRNR